MGVIDPIKVIIENYPEKQVETLKAPIHPQNEDKGKRDIFFSQALYIDCHDKNTLLSQTGRLIQA
jgi:glutaminyl-tRNA synthetase